MNEAQIDKIIKKMIDKDIKIVKLKQGLKDLKSQLIDGGMKSDSLIILSIKNLLA